MLHQVDRATGIATLAARGERNLALGDVEDLSAFGLDAAHA
ncbi:hypothetical protein [Mycobacterium tilburgii]|nr:hypothetical protein [Mycobacterium tilburgii]